MEVMTLKNLIKPLQKAEIVGNNEAIVIGIDYDSRRVRKGFAFIAVSGFKTDGNEYIAQAIENGASAIISERKTEMNVPLVVVPEIRRAMSDIAANFFGYPGRNLEIAGVTGTNGKSTSVYLLKNILEKADGKCGMINSLVYDTGAGRYKAERTTPESIDVQRLLSEMIQASCICGVVEVSSHALVLHRVDNIDFKVGLFTNFSRDHLDFHKTMDEYLNAKKLFLNKLAGENRTAVINMDVPEFAAFRDDVKGRFLGYSPEGRKADVMLKNAELHQDHSTFDLVTDAGQARVRLQLPGRYNLSNACGAAAAALALGIDIETVAEGLNSAQPVPGRFEPVDCGQPFLVIIDYAHTSDAIERLCQSAREITTGRLLILFGCGGDRDRGKRPLMGKAATTNADFAVITSDNPRSENPQTIIDDIIPGMQGNDYMVIQDRAEAIAEIVGRARENDTVLIAGKGAEDYQEIGMQRFPFDDKAEIIAALKQMGYEGSER